MIEFFVPGVPVAQPRQRHAMIAGHVRNYTPTKHPVNAFKASVKVALSDGYSGPPLDGAIYLAVVFVLPRPKSKCWKKRPQPREYHTVKPDMDNMLKAVKDALKGLMWKDDSQVCLCDASKYIASGDEQPHTEIRVKQIGELYGGGSTAR